MIWLVPLAAVGAGVAVWWLGGRVDARRLPEWHFTKEEVDRRIEALERMYRSS